LIYSWVKLIEQNGKIEIRVYMSEAVPYKIQGQIFIDMFFNSGTTNESIELFVNEYCTEYYNSLPEPIVEEENG
jgi:hypothetical protein